MKQRIFRKYNNCILWIILTGLTLSGCANLSSIREFADVSVESAQYQALVNDYVTYPDRQLRYVPANRQAIWEQMKVKRVAQRDALLARVTLTQEYMSALGQLAADSAVNFDEGIDGLGTSITSNEFANAEEVAAVSQIAKLLLRVATDAWRQRELKQLIDEANAPFQVVIDAQKKILMQGFGGDAEEERIAANKYYSALLKRSSDPAGIAAMQEWRALRQAEITARASAVKAFTQVLDNIGQGHQQLYAGRNDLTSPAMRDQIKNTANELRKLIRLIRDL